MLLTRADGASGVRTSDRARSQHAADPLRGDESAPCSRQPMLDVSTLRHTWFQVMGRAVIRRPRPARRSRRPCGAARWPGGRSGPRRPAPARWASAGRPAGGPARGCSRRRPRRATTPGTALLTSSRTRRVARQGWQNAVENWTRVARSPSAAPSSVASTTSRVSTGSVRARPSRRPERCSHRPTAVARTSVMATASSPPMPGPTGPAGDRFPRSARGAPVSRRAPGPAGRRPARRAAPAAPHRAAGAGRAPGRRAQRPAGPPPHRPLPRRARR